MSTNLETPERVAAHPLLERLINEFDAQWLSEENLSQLLEASGDQVLFLMGDKDRFPEALDVAVVLPELQAQYPGRLRAWVGRAESEKALAKHFASRVWPALVFVRDGQYVGVIGGMHDWDVYVQKVGEMLEAPTKRIPIAIVANNG